MWAVRCRQNGRSKKYTIGRYPVYGLAEAREVAARILRSVSEGRDPARSNTGTVAEAVEQFLDRHGKHYRSKPLYEAKRRLQLYVVNNWGSRKLDSVSRADVRAMLDKIDRPIAANRVHSIVRKFFNWCVENDLITNSPVAGIKTPNPETSRDRTLTDDELRSVWLAADETGYPFGPIVQLLILTGQRRTEVSRMERPELALDAGIWTLPKERTKNSRRHEVPLSSQAIGLLCGLPRIGDRYVFSVNGSKPFNGFKAKEGFCPDLAPWTLHDLRRTMASGMARLGVSLVVIEKVLNHVSGSLAGIVGVYQRHEFADEKRAALQLWANHVEGLVRPRHDQAKTRREARTASR